MFYDLIKVLALLYGNSLQMNPDGNIQYDFILDTAHPQIKDLLTAALNKCRVIEGNSSLS